MERDWFRCQYCGKNGKDVSLEVDHIIPKAKWGTDDFDNLITCCRECNIGKGDDIIWVNINMGKMKIAEHEQKTLKQFFDTWNKLKNGTIDKDNVAFISWFIKLYYEDFLKDHLEYEVHSWRLTQWEFDEWGVKCEESLNRFEHYNIQPELEYIFDNLENSTPKNDSERTRWTNDYNERLNWLLTYSMAFAQLSKPFIYKYSVCPHKIDEWWGE